MRIRFQWKTKDSTIENCPARYVVLDAPGGYVIQGKKIDDDTRAQLRNLADDETAVWVPADVINRKELADGRIYHRTRIPQMATVV
jgi:hypothetical protein